MIVSRKCFSINLKAVIIDQNIPHKLEKLSLSKFRSRFKLDGKDIEYIKRIGLLKVESHARNFITQKLSAALPKNDGKQTFFKGHPVFKAQHATATCCRSCLAKWHRIPTAIALDKSSIDSIVKIIMAWIEKGGRL